MDTCNWFPWFAWAFVAFVSYASARYGSGPLRRDPEFRKRQFEDEKDWPFGSQAKFLWYSWLLFRWNWVLGSVFVVIGVVSWVMCQLGV